MTHTDDKPAGETATGQDAADKPAEGKATGKATGKSANPPKEVGGPSGPEPTRYGDWERNGRVSDF